MYYNKIRYEKDVEALKNTNHRAWELWRVGFGISNQGINNNPKNRNFSGCKRIPEADDLISEWTKVYCQHCRYLEYIEFGGSPPTMFCKHHKNRWFMDTPYQRKYYNNSITVVNENNDCECFEKKQGFLCAI